MAARKIENGRAWCSKRKHFVELAGFSLRPSGTLHPWCKSCRNSYTRAREHGLGQHQVVEPLGFPFAGAELREALRWNPLIRVGRLWFCFACERFGRPGPSAACENCGAEASPNA